MCYGAHLVFYKVYWKFPTIGCKQIKDVDFFDTYSPVSKVTTLEF